MRKNSVQGVPPAEPVQLDQDDFFNFLICAVCSFAVYALCCSHYIREWDAAEMALSIDQLGLSHPPGAALYTMCGRVYLLLAGSVTPFSQEFLINLFSAGSLALACGFFYLLLALFTTRRQLALLVAWACGFSALPWSQAGYSEVYAFWMMWLALFLFCWMHWLRTGNPRSLFLSALVFSLCLGAHLLSCALAPGILITLLLNFRKLRRASEFWFAALYLLLGLSWVLYIWIRSRYAPMIGTAHRPDTLSQLWHYFHVDQFRELSSMKDPVYWRVVLLKRAILTPALLIAGTLGCGIWFALLGLLDSYSRSRDYLIMLLTFIGTFLLLTLANVMADYSALISAPFVFLPLALLFGIERRLERALLQGGRIRQTQQSALRLAGALVIAELIVFPVVTWSNHRFQPEWQSMNKLQKWQDKSLQQFLQGLSCLNVYYPDDAEPYRNTAAIRERLNTIPGPKVFSGNWEIQALLTYHQFADGWFPDTWFFEWLDQRRFYTYGAEGDLITQSYEDLIEKYSGERAIFLLMRDETPATISGMYDFTGRIVELVDSYVFSNSRYYLYRISTKLPPPVPLEQLAPAELPGARGSIP